VGEEYTGVDEDVQLKAVYSIWLAFRNITCGTAAINKDQAVALFDTGIDIIHQLKSVEGQFTSLILEHVFCTLDNIVFAYNYITKEHFQDKGILSKCLDAFKKDDTWECRSENVFVSVTSFLKRCLAEELWDHSSDFEMLLPILVIGLKKFPLNDRIQNISITLLVGACRMINDKKIIERSNAMEPLAVFLASGNNINEAKKIKIRSFIHKISAP